jgi:acyl carrier protein
MNKNEELVKEVIAWLSKILRKEVDATNLDANLINDYGADSMDVVDIVDTMESKYGLSITNEEISDLQTINDILHRIETSAI